MRTIKFTSLALLIIAISLFTGTPISYSSSNDDNHLSANDSVYSPPGYMNKDIQQARSLTDKYLANKDKAANKTEATQREVSQKVQVQAVDKPKPQLKQKQSSANKTQAANQVEVRVGAGAQDIAYKPEGTVISSEKNAQGKIIAETFLFNGVQTRHIYVSNDSGTYALSSVINGIKAARNGKGDVVLIKEGSYDIVWDQSAAQSLLYRDNIKIIGERVTSTIINSRQDVYGFSVFRSSNITIKNLTISGENSKSKYSGLAFTVSTNCTAENNIIKGFAQSGIVVSDAECKNIKILNNTVESNKFGINIGSTQSISVNGNIASKNSDTGFNLNFFNVPTLSFSGNYAYDNNSNYFVSFFGSKYADTNYLISPFKDTASNKTNGTTEGVLPSIKEYMDVSGMYGRSTSYNSFGNTDLLKKFIVTNEAGEALKTLLKGKGAMTDNTGAQPINAISAQTFGQAALQPQSQNMEIAMNLANIMQNPTEAQKVTIDSIKALLSDINKVEDALANQSPELKKATDDLLNAVANILLAQAMPDLIKSGDVSNIKAMFSELDTQRNKIMLDYSIATKPYYENMIKDMAKNMAMLQDKNLLNPNMSKEELYKLPPSELDKILDKIRNMKDRSFEEEYLLQQEAKYRKDYLDPNNKKLEDDMKGMLESFAGRINDVLKSAEKK